MVTEGSVLAVYQQSKGATAASPCREMKRKKQSS